MNKMRSIYSLIQQFLKLPTGQLEAFEVQHKKLLQVTVQGLCDDSRELHFGDLFIALHGKRNDGAIFIDQAIERGAVAVFVERCAAWTEIQVYRNIVVVAVDDLAKKLPPLVADFYAQPSQRLNLVGITGTNAKTSCACYLQQLLNLLDEQCGIIGTLGWGLKEPLHPTVNTTPSNLSLHKILNHFVQQNVDNAVMEVSSHGIQLGRLQELDFKIAVFTNLSQDHLDFHGSMQAYADAKKQLFTNKALHTAVINMDDDYAPQFIDVLAPQVKLISYGFSKQAELRISNFESTLNGLQAKLHYRGDEYLLRSSLLGDFNIYNLAAALSVLIAQGYPLSDVVENIPSVNAVKGRMERVYVDRLKQPLTANSDNASIQDLVVVVDYAHTPDGLQQVLATLRKHIHSNTLWCVFGCGGERDKEKRPLMGAVVAQYADKIIVTSDNPRAELAQSIIDDIALAEDNKRIFHQPDRADAIHYAITSAEAGDCVLIAGKGHENYQEINNQRLPFDDFLVTQTALQQRMEGAL